MKTYAGMQPRQLVENAAPVKLRVPAPARLSPVSDLRLPIRPRKEEAAGERLRAEMMGSVEDRPPVAFFAISNRAQLKFLRSRAHEAAPPHRVRAHRGAPRRAGELKM
jgi:hypothetical protein